MPITHRGQSDISCAHKRMCINTHSSAGLFWITALTIKKTSALTAKRQVHWLRSNTPKTTTTNKQYVRILHVTQTHPTSKNDTLFSTKKSALSYFPSSRAPVQDLKLFNWVQFYSDNIAREYWFSHVLLQSTPASLPSISNGGSSLNSCWGCKSLHPNEIHGPWQLVLVQPAADTVQ